MSDDRCHLCDEPEIAYVDVLGLPWCKTCMDDIYWADA